eukprot:1010940_1
MRLAKILIKYKRWLFTIYTESKGKDDIERTAQVDIAKFVNDDQFKSTFMQRINGLGILAPHEFESVIKSMDNITRDVADAEAFLQLDIDTFVAIIQKHVSVPKVFVVKLHTAIRKAIKKALKQNMTADHDVFVQIIINHLETMQNISKSLRDALDCNANGIARIATFMSARRKEFGKMIQNECKLSLALSLKLRDTILYTLKQKAQTQQFGEFLSDLDIEGITNDYHHVLKVHIREGESQQIENCLRFFKYAVHFEDKATEINECRSVKRKDKRRYRLNTHYNQDEEDNALNDEANKDIWKLKQHYIQNQLDIIHSYLVHSKWQRSVKKYSKHAIDSDGDKDRLKGQVYDEDEDDLEIQNKSKYVTDIKDSN